jgi:hypothetical protein
MAMDAVIERCARQSPVTVMARLARRERWSTLGYVAYERQTL